MMFEAQTVRFARAITAASIIAAAHDAAVAWVLHQPAPPNENSQIGGAFIFELADITASPEEDRRDVAVGPKSDEIAPVAASLPQQTSVAEPKPLEEEPSVPESTEPPPEDALAKPPEEQPLDDVKPQDMKIAQAHDAVAQAAVAAREAAAPTLIKNAQEVSEVPRGQNMGLSNIDRQAIKNWQRDLVLHLNRHKRYPSAAREQRQHGVVNIAFTMDNKGRVLNARVAKSSGHDLLDTAAIAMVNQASPLPVPPGSMDDSINLVVPVNYRWRD